MNGTIPGTMPTYGTPPLSPVFTYNPLNFAVTYSGGAIQEEKNMKKVTKYVFEVIVIDTEGDLVIHEPVVVATTSEDAKMKAGVFTFLSDNDLESSDVSVLVINRGTVSVNRKDY